MNLDDLLDLVKVSVASIAGLGNWLVDMDLLVKLMLSIASLIYVVLKIKELLNKR